MPIKLRHATILGLVLIAAGLGVFLAKVIGLGYPLAPGVKSSAWDFEIFIEFEGRDEPARIEALLPTTALNRQLSAEQFYNGSFGLSIVNDAPAQTRKAVWTYRYPSNRKVLRYSVRTIGESERTALPASFLEEKPDAIPFEADVVKRQAFIVYAGNLRQRSADDLSFADLAVQAAFAEIDGDQPNADELTVLLGADASVRNRLELARHTLQSQGIPARVAHGVYLDREERREAVRHWLEYAVDGVEHRHFPGGAPREFFTLWYGPGALVNAAGVANVDTQLSVRPADERLLDVVRRSDGKLAGAVGVVTLAGLPLTTQLVYKVLLTIPVGIAILVFLRQFIGVKTLGTFMPVLIGIAFRETALVNGLLLFTLLIALGLALRFYLERLQLLLVPRLAVVLIFIVIVMAGLTVAMTGANQSIGLSISLFPMVILTMTIERMSIVWEESSAGDAIKQGLGSLGVASLTYLAMVNDRVEYLMYQFPELLLVLMGLCVLMGRYTGLRLSEVWRFRALARAA
ncbi:MAG: UUP1 family membrane protein [Pseudomonadota bacterium]